MSLNKVLLGDLIEISNERNVENIICDFYGININKEFMPSVADTSNVDRKKYKVLIKNRFVFSGMQTGRDDCIRIGIYTDKKPVLVSPAYTTFEVVDKRILPLYLFMIFNSKEMDRYGSFLSDSSIRSNLDWDRFCSIQISLPSIDIQRKYVKVYESLLSNLDVYQKGLDDLKLVCDGYIEKLRKEYKSEEIGRYISLKRNKNIDGSIKNVFGVSNTLEFVEASSTVNKDNLFNYKIVEYQDIAYVPTTHMKIWACAISDNKYPFVVSPIYEVFEVYDKNILCPEYLFMWLCRSETIRLAYYNSWGSARENFVFDDMCKIKIPIPPIEIQQSIVKVYMAYKKRKEFVDKLKMQISQICPVLIRGSIIEGEQQK